MTAVAGTKPVQTKRTLDEHKVYLGQMLHTNGIKPKSKQGAAVIWAYWQGVLHESGKDWPYVVICLMSGRHEELQTPPSKESCLEAADVNLTTLE